MASSMYARVLAHASRARTGAAHACARVCAHRSMSVCWKGAGGKTRCAMSESKGEQHRKASSQRGHGRPSQSQRAWPRVLYINHRSLGRLSNCVLLPFK
eukprot:1035143-Pleurochrysis_carterae.AAC.2